MSSSHRSWRMSIEDFVRYTYKFALRREVDTEALLHWSAMLEESRDPSQLYSEILHSAEYREVVRADQRYFSADDLSALSERVTVLIERGEPVKIEVGPGPVPAIGFVNIDGFKHEIINEAFSAVDRVYVFPLTSMRWPFPDNSVDFIFSQDFFEHLDQREQIIFLAETYRVLKPGGIQRINAPDLVYSMRTNSNFSSGFDGVYIDEWAGLDAHRHKSLPTHASLAEMANMVGFRKYLPCLKGKSNSPFFLSEYRPSPPKSELDGNVIAELLK